MEKGEEDIPRHGGKREQSTEARSSTGCGLADLASEVTPPGRSPLRHRLLS